MWGTKHWVRFELGYRKNEASSSAILPGHFGYQVFSGSAMWDWQILEQVTATNAVRIDRFSLSQYGPVPAASPFSARSYNDRVIYEPSFNSGIAWKATDFDTFRITGSRGVQLPSIYDLALQDREPSVGLYPAYYYLGNPRLSAVSIWNIETGWDRKIPDLNSTTRVSVFAQRTDNIITNPYEAAPVANGNELVARSFHRRNARPDSDSLSVRANLARGVNDGRALPKNAGGDEPTAPDPRYYGYSVGHWDGDTTLVVDTTVRSAYQRRLARRTAE